MHQSTFFTTALALASGVAATWPTPAAPYAPAKPSGGTWQSTPYWNTTGSNGTSTTSSSSPQDTVHVVRVGWNGQLTFDPPNTLADVGNHVQFQFYPMNHSVVQASFDSPCVPINNVDPTTKGFFSGFMPAAVASPDHLVFDVQVTTADPIWFYCSQSDHCQSGMVGAINADDSSSKSVWAFAQKATKAKWNLTPGVPPPGATWNGGSTGTAPPPPPPASTTLSTTSAPPPPPGSTTTAPPPPPGTSSPPPTAAASRVGASVLLGITALAAVLML